MSRIRHDDIGIALRDKILEMLYDSPTSADDDLKTMLQCVSHIKNRMIVEQTAKKCRLTLSGFNMNDVLELHYDLKKGRQDVGWISKGWEDPGFRVSNLIKVPKTNMPALKDHTYDLMNFCAVRGVIVTFGEQGEAVEVLMESVIYSDGFNMKVFKQILYYLNICVERATILFGAS